MYEFEYELQKEEYMDFNLYHAKESAIVKRYIKVYRIVGPIFLLIFGYFLTKGFKNIDGLIIFGIGAILFSIFWPIIYSLQIKRNVKKIVNDGAGKSYLKLTKVVIQPQNITYEIPSEGIFKKYSKILKIQENGNNIFLYVSDIEAIILPKKIVGEDKEIIKFINYCKSI